jgi:N-acyl amino acid synthase of PEP-CTERM/exosortase system
MSQDVATVPTAQRLQRDAGSRRRHDLTTRHFDARTIDDDPRLLESSYRLRYQVYCLERKFLPAENYPDQLEVDEFDLLSIHVGAVDACGELAGTARVVRTSDAGFPLVRHCTIDPDEAALFGSHSTPVEVSRLSVSRNYSRRDGDGWYGSKGGLGFVAGATGRSRERRHRRGEVFLTLLKAVYQTTKRIGATHWLAATEQSMQRMLAQHGFPFRQIGPEIDYAGPVAPYAMDLREFDAVILSRRFQVLDEFLIGLEPEFRPRPDRAA